MKKYLLGALLATCLAGGAQAQDGNVSTVAGTPWKTVGDASEVTYTSVGPMAYRQGHIYFLNPQTEALYKVSLTTRQVSLIKRGGLGNTINTLRFVNDSTLILNSYNGCFCLRSINVNSGEATTYLQFSGQGADIRPRSFAIDTTNRLVYGWTDAGKFHKVDLRTGGDTILPFNVTQRTIFAMNLDPTKQYMYMADDGGGAYKYDLAARSFTAIRGIPRGTQDIQADAANQYVYFANSDRHLIYRLDVANPTATAVPWAGAENQANLINGYRQDARFNGSASITLVGNNFYIADRDNGRIRVISSDTVRTFLGTPKLVNGPAAQAKFNGAARLVSTDSGTVYIIDYNNNVIRKISNSLVTTLAGQTDLSGSGIPGFRNGAGNQARFENLAAITLLDTALYISELSRNGIRRINLASGNVSQFATEGKPSAMIIRGDSILASDGSRIYAYALSNGNRRSFAGTGTRGYQNGPAKDSAQFDNAQDLVIDGDNLYIADEGNSRVRRMSLSLRRVYPFVGNGQDDVTGGHINSVGTRARLFRPSGLGLVRGTLIIARRGKSIITKALLTGTNPTSTHAGLEQAPGFRDGLSDQAQFNGVSYVDYQPNRNYGLIADGGNNLIRRIDLRFNSAPGFTTGGDVTLSPRTTPAYTAPWAQTITKGNNASFNESRQALTFTVLVDNSALFIQQPRLDTNGVLAFRAVANPSAVGRTADTAMVTVLLKDNGGTAFGGVDSASRISFRIILDFLTANKPSIRAEQMRVQPNPAKSGTATLILSTPGIVTVSDVTGRQVWQSRVEGKQQLPALRPGLYLARAQSQGLVYRFVIE